MPGRRARNLGREERGQSLVEFVLALPILLVIVFGIIEFAAAWRTFQVITNVAREGARRAVVFNAEPDPVIRARIDTMLIRNGLDHTQAQVTFKCNGTSGGLCPPLTVTNGEEAVEIVFPHRFVVLGPVLDLMCIGCGSYAGTVNLRTSTIMRSEQ